MIGWIRGIPSFEQSALEGWGTEHLREAQSAPPQVVSRCS